MKNLTFGSTIQQFERYVSSGTISNMPLEKGIEISIKSDGIYAFFDIKQTLEHHRITLNKSQSSLVEPE